MADLTAIKKIYRIVSWISLAGLVLVIILVLKKSPAPDVPYDPNAAARVQQKFAAADQAKAAGQAHLTELKRSASARMVSIASPAAAPKQQRILRLGVGEPWTRPDALIHLQRMLEMRFRLVELAERRRQHSEIPARRAVAHRHDSGRDRPDHPAHGHHT